MCVYMGKMCVYMRNVCICIIVGEQIWNIKICLLDWERNILVYSMNFGWFHEVLADDLLVRGDSLEWWGLINFMVWNSKKNSEEQKFDYLKVFMFGVLPINTYLQSNNRSKQFYRNTLCCYARSRWEPSYARLIGLNLCDIFASNCIDQIFIEF